MEKIEIERALDEKRREESLKRKEKEKEKELELRFKEIEFRKKTNRILNDQESRIERKRQELDAYLS